MPNYNKLILIGHLTKDVETNYTTNGTAVAKSTIAVNNGYGDNKKTMFIDFKCWSKTSEFLAKHFKKGSAILLEGELEQESWEDKNGGGKRSKHVFNVLTIKFVGDKSDAKEETTSERVQQIVDSQSNDDVPF